MLFCDVELLLSVVAADLDDLHSVFKRAGDRAAVIRRRYEHDVRKVKRQVDVVISERVVLLGIEHLEKSAGRVSLIVGGELVDLVEDNKRVVRTRGIYSGNYASGHRGYVSPPVTSDLGFVANAAQSDTLDLAPDSRADRLRDRRLSDAWRTYEAEYLTLYVWRKLAHCEILDDALLYLVKTVVVAVERLFNVLYVDLVLRGFAPGKL